MADIRVEGSELVLVLSGLEKVEGVHGDIRVPLTAVRDVEVVDRPLDLIHGLKMPGTGIPGMTAVGSWISSDGRTFAVEHHTSRGIVVHLEGLPYQQLIVGSDDPEGLAERVRSAIAGQTG
ncbi:MAG TPA: hypothetical protein VNH38_02235 [Candidatus Dormibacteraeota bacterium]|nr:hypothetical protein [Candidatus Dormibacteraeota bacterium]